MSTFPTIEISAPALTPPGVSFVTVQSPALGRRVDLSVYVPPGGDAESLPLVTLLHGVYGSHWAWLFKGGAHRVLERLMAEEGLLPMVLAMPSDGLWGDGSGYLRHAEADYRRWIVEEVPAAVAEVEPRVLGAKRFIAGLSMGGYGALRIGALHADRYGGISGHSSVTDAEVLQRFILAGSGEMALAEDAPLDVLSCVRAAGETLPPLRFDCGTEDELIEANRALHADLVVEGVEHEYAEFSGGHTWEYWNAHLADSLRFFAGLV